MEHPQYPRVLYTVSEIGQDVSSALRTANNIALLRCPVPYFHDGTAATIDDVVTPYNNFRRLQVLRRTATGSSPVPEIVGTTLGSKDFLDEGHFCAGTGRMGIEE